MESFLKKAVWLIIIAPAISDEDAKAKFPKGWKTLKPYLRVTPQPDK